MHTTLSKLMNIMFIIRTLAVAVRISGILNNLSENSFLLLKEKKVRNVHFYKQYTIAVCFDFPIT